MRGGWGKVSYVEMDFKSSACQNNKIITGSQFEINKNWLQLV